MIVYVTDILNDNTVKLEGDGNFIEPMKKLVFDTDTVCGNFHKTICSMMKASGFNDTELDDSPDYTLNIKEGWPVVKVLSENDTQTIFVGKIYGNCVDRFMMHNIGTFMGRIYLHTTKLMNNSLARSKSNDYLDTPKFEADFKELTELKRLCETMASKIGKFQENITFGYK